VLSNKCSESAVKRLTAAFGGGGPSTSSRRESYSAFSSARVAPGFPTSRGGPVPPPKDRLAVSGQGAYHFPFRASLRPRPCKIGTKTTPLFPFLLVGPVQSPSTRRESLPPSVIWKMRTSCFTQSLFLTADRNHGQYQHLSLLSGRTKPATCADCLLDSGAPLSNLREKRLISTPSRNVLTRTCKGMQPSSVDRTARAARKPSLIPLPALSPAIRE